MPPAVGRCKEVQKGLEGGSIAVLDHDDFGNALLHARRQLFAEYFGSCTENLRVSMDHLVLHMNCTSLQLPSSSSACVSSLIVGAGTSAVRLKGRELAYS